MEQSPYIYYGTGDNRTLYNFIIFIIMYILIFNYYSYINHYLSKFLDYLV